MINSNYCFATIYPKTPQETRNHATPDLDDATDKIDPILCAIVAPATRKKQEIFRCSHIRPYIKSSIIFTTHPQS